MRYFNEILFIKVVVLTAKICSVYSYGEMAGRAYRCRTLYKEQFFDSIQKVKQFPPHYHHATASYVLLLFKFSISNSLRNVNK